MEKRDILSMTLDELTFEIKEMGQPKYRAAQIYKWLHEKKVSRWKDC